MNNIQIVDIKVQSIKWNGHLVLSIQKNQDLFFSAYSLK